MKVPFREVGIVTLDGSGNGTASVGPLTARETWYPELVAMSVSTPIVKEASGLVYAGDQALQQYLVDGCTDASSGDSTGNIEGRILRSGQKIFGVFSGGDAGHIAMMVVTGQKDI